MSSPASTRDQDIERVFSDWEDLRTERPHTRTGPVSRGRIGSILNFIGLPYYDESQVTVRNDREPNTSWAHFAFQCNLDITDSIKGAPLFGSQSKGTYHIFCYWEHAQLHRLKGTRLLRTLARGNQEAVIAIYLNSLTESERQDIGNWSWSGDLTIAVLDETLLAFLTTFEEGRFRRFLELTIPFTASNPYNPVTTGFGARVSPEMFYGRDQLANEVSAMRNGTYLVFGGRQLGKSALLRRVEETFSQPDLRRFAWLIDIKDNKFVPTKEAGEPEDPGDIIAILHDNFRRSGILAAREHAADMKQMRQDIVAVFEEDKELYVLAMFDEADAFLEADWTAGSPMVDFLRTLMDTTENRFKVVFSGLHNVQRFAYGPNNPFPNLGFNPNNPRRGGIGPLSDHEARSLVEEPFSLLGFKFRPLVVDKILSYTNRHPSLIQFFCHELIQSYRRGNSDRTPPFDIGIEDVDRVYRTKAIRDGIKHRFEQTFVLDERYRVISLTMILEQGENRPTRSWSLDELRFHCQSYCPLTFDPDNLSSLELRALLNELIGLGVLAESEGYYRFRSSLIPQMFGNRNEIQDTLVELMVREPF